MLSDLFKTPSAFVGDPRGYARNQVGHALIGAALVWLGAPIWLVVGAYALWEFLQWFRLDAEAHDAFEDLGFFTGGLMAVVVSPWCLALSALFLASGVSRRRDEQSARNRDMRL